MTVGPKYINETARDNQIFTKHIAALYTCLVGRRTVRINGSHLDSNESEVIPSRFSHVVPRVF